MTRYRTPLRYPGGKQRLAPFVLELLQANSLVGGHYVEPYAGGAGVAMELLLNSHVEAVHLNDSSKPIFDFWGSILSRSEEFCKKISDTDISVEEWKKQREIVRSPELYEQIDVGFAAFYLNRCNRSGVLSGGLIGGLDQTGKWKMDARFPKSELIKRINNIAKVSSRIHIQNTDAEDFIKNYISSLPDETFVYCDPPYFDKASRLYLDHYRGDDHARIARVIQGNIKQKWIVSYDSCDEIKKHYELRRSFVYDLQYNAAAAYKGKEVFIFSDTITIPRRSKINSVNSAIKENERILCVGGAL